MLRSRVFHQRNGGRSPYDANLDILPAPCSYRFSVSEAAVFYVRKHMPGKGGWGIQLMSFSLLGGFSIVLLLGWWRDRVLNKWLGGVEDGLEAVMARWYISCWVVSVDDLAVLSLVQILWTMWKFVCGLGYFIQQQVNQVLWPWTLPISSRRFFLSLPGHVLYLIKPFLVNPTRSARGQDHGIHRFASVLSVVDLTNPKRSGNPLIFDVHETCVSQTS